MTRLQWAVLVAAVAIVFGACKIEPRSRAVADPDTTGAAGTFDAADASASPEAPALPDPDDDRPLAQRIRDASIEAQVTLALSETSELRLYDFGVDVQRGVVTLTGEVPSADHREQAEAVARGVQGVRSVANVVAAPDVVLTAVTETLTTSQSVQAPVESAPAVSSEPTAPVASASPDDAPSANTQQAAPEAEYHTVSSGESLWIIARRYGTSIDTIMRLNNLQNDRVRPGQRLRVR